MEQQLGNADLPHKILLLTGPRQCGKTTLAKAMLPDFDYLNPDLAEHRLILKEDLLTLTAMRDIQSIETLIELLRSRVGSPVSATALAQDLRRCDVEGEEPGLHCIRNKDGHEVDFLVTRNKRPHLMLEVIWSDNNLSPNFRKLLPKAPEEAVPCIQIVGELERAKSFPTGERVMAAQEFLADLTALDVSAGT